MMQSNVETEDAREKKRQLLMNETTTKSTSVHKKKSSKHAKSPETPVSQQANNPHQQPIQDTQFQSARPKVSKKKQ